MNATALAAAAREHAGPTGPRWWPPVARHVQQLGSWIRAPQRAVSWAWTAYKPQPGPMEWQLPDTNEPKTLILMRIRMVCIIWSLYLMNLLVHRIIIFAWPRRPTRLSFTKRLVVRAIPLMLMWRCFLTALGMVKHEFPELGVLPQTIESIPFHADIFWTLFRSLCVVTLVETLCYTMEAPNPNEFQPPPLSLSGMTLLEAYSSRKSPEMAAYAAFKAVSYLSHQILEIFRLHKLRLVVTSVNSLAFAGYLTYCFACGQLNFPISAFIGWLPHIFTLVVIAVCSVVSLVARWLSGGVGNLRVNLFDHHMFRVSLEDDCLNVLSKWAEVALADAKDTALLTQSFDVNVPLRTFVGHRGDADSPFQPPTSGLRIERQLGSNFGSSNAIRGSMDASLRLLGQMFRLLGTLALRGKRSLLARWRGRGLVPGKTLQPEFEALPAKEQAWDEDALYRDFVAQRAIPDDTDDEYSPLNAADEDSASDCSASNHDDDDGDAPSLINELFPDAVSVWNFFTRDDTSALRAWPSEAPPDSDEALVRTIIRSRSRRRAATSSARYRAEVGRMDFDEPSVSPAVCVVCQSSPRTIILWPCRCLVMCDDCRQSLSLHQFSGCPCCRREVASYSRIWIP